MDITEILRLNNISFETYVSHASSSPTKSFLGGGAMESFFFFFSDANDIETEVIPVIEHYLNGNPFSIDNDLTVGGGDFVEVTLAGVKFLNRNTLKEEQVVPLDQFKAISTAWLNFIKEQ